MKMTDTFFPDHFDQADKAGVFLGVVTMIVSLYLLYEIRPNTSLRSNKIIAQLSLYKNNVKFKEAGSVAFYEVRTKENFQSNDEIFTGKNSEASVKFIKSGSVLKIPSSSLVRIEEGDDGDIVEVKDGVVSLVLEKDQKINLRQDGVLHTIESDKNTSVKVFNTDGILRVLPKDNGVKLKGVDGDAEFQKNIETQIPLQVNKMFNLLEPQAGEKIPFDTSYKITVDKEDSYKVELSKGADFKKIIETSNFNGKEYTWNLNVSDGDYFLRVQSKDTSKTIPITLVTKYQIENFKPENGSVATATPSEGIKLSWDPIPTGKYYLHIKDRNGDIKSSNIASNEFQVQSISGEALEWTVTSKEMSKTSLANMDFNRVSLNYQGEVTFTKSADKKEYEINEKEIKLSWTSSSPSSYEVKVLDGQTNVEVYSSVLNKADLTLPLTKIGEYKIDVASKDFPSFKKASTRITVTAPAVEWVEGQEKIIKTTDVDHHLKLAFTKNIDDLDAVNFFYKFQGSEKEVKVKPEALQDLLLTEFGDYCFSAKLKDEQKYYRNPKDFCFKLVQLPPFEALPRAKDSILEYTKNDGGVETYIVKVPAIKNATKYDYAIYKDNKGKELIFKDTTTTPQFKWTTRRSGIFFLQYKVYNERGRVSELSPFSRIIFPISPLSNW